MNQLQGQADHLAELQRSYHLNFVVAAASCGAEADIDLPEGSLPTCCPSLPRLFLDALHI